MTYVRTSSARYGEDYYVSERVVNNDAHREGAESLLGASLAHYNAALSALRSDQPVFAVASVERALKVFPYALRPVELALALHLKHGDIGRAEQLRQHLETLGEQTLAGSYQPLVADAAQAWNGLIEAPAEALATREGRPLGYREALCLAQHHPTLLVGPHRFAAERFGLTAQEEDASPAMSVTALRSVAESPATDRWRWLAMAAVAVAVLLAGYVLAGAPLNRTSGEPTPNDGIAQTADAGASGEDPLVADPRARADRDWDPVEQTVLGFVTGTVSPGVALGRLDSVSATVQEDPSEVRRARGLILGGVRSEADSAWRARDYSEVVRLLRATDRTARPEDHYRFGIAAAETGNPTTAITALERSLAGGAGSYFEAEALYRLALLTDEPEQREYALALVEKYPGTIYNNSQIAAILSE